MSDTTNQTSTAAQNKPPPKRKLLSYLVVIGLVLVGMAYFNYIDSKDNAVNQDFYRVLYEASVEFNTKLNQLKSMHDYKDSLTGIRSLLPTYELFNGEPLTGIDKDPCLNKKVEIDTEGNDSSLRKNILVSSNAQGETDSAKVFVNIVESTSANEKYSECDKPKIDEEEYKYNLFGSKLVVQKSNKDYAKLRIVDLLPFPTNGFSQYLFVNSSGEVLDSIGGEKSLSVTNLEDIKKEGLVKVTGFCSDIASVFSSANIVVLPSYREGLPKVLIEAAACGRAIVTTDVPGCRDAIEPDITGLLCKVKDANSLANAIERLILDKELRNSMGKSGRELAEKYFDINHIVKKHFDIYEGVL